MLKKTTGKNTLYLILLYQFTLAQNRPKSDISGALRPIHYITLKAFAMALGDRTKCKTCFGCPRMVLCGPWKTFWSNQGVQPRIGPKTMVPHKKFLVFFSIFPLFQISESGTSQLLLFSHPEKKGTLRNQWQSLYNSRFTNTSLNPAKLCSRAISLSKHLGSASCWSASRRYLSGK